MALLNQKISDDEYLFLATRVRCMENRLLTAQRQEQMLEAPTDLDALKILRECGYPEPEERVDADTVDAMLAAERDRVFADLAQFAPDSAIVDIFRSKYDYHNIKTLLKAAALGMDASRLLVNAGRVPVKTLEEAVASGNTAMLPATLASAIAKAREVLGSTQDPQLADFVLDAAWLRDMAEVAESSGCSFLQGYVRLLIDTANLKSVVRTQRMGKGAEFLENVIFSGGTVDRRRVLAAATSGANLSELFGTTDLKAAAESGAAAMSGGSLTQFERDCDNAAIRYVSSAKYHTLGPSTVIAYLVAKDTELTAVRIIMMGRLAGLPAATVRERLRDCYV